MASQAAAATTKPINTEDITPADTQMKEVDTTGVHSPVSSWTENVDKTNTDLINEWVDSWTATQDALTQWLTEDINTKDNLEDVTNTRIDENTQYANDAVTRTEDYADKKIEIINKTSDEQAKIEADKAALLEQSKQDTLDALKAEQDASKARQEAELEAARQAQALQEQKDKDAIIQAEADMEVAQQQSAWAFNKLWLNFSSGAVLMTQKIATDGAAQLATLKVQANYNQAKLTVDVEKLNEEINKSQLEYTKQINDTIFKYDNMALDLKSQSTNRIAEVQNNLLLTNAEKEEKINTILKDLKDWNRNLEDKLQTDQERLTNNIISKTKQLQTEHERIQEKWKVKLSEDILTWNIMNMSPEELNREEDKLGLPRWSIMQKTTDYISKWIRNMYDTTLWKDVLINNMADMDLEVKKLMKQWKTTNEAISIVWTKYIENSPEYKAKKAAEKAKMSWWSKTSSININAEAWKIVAAAKQRWENISMTTAKWLAAAWETATTYYLWAVKPKTKTSPLLNSSIETFKGDYENPAAAKSAYNELIKSWYSKDEALQTLASQNDNLEIVDWQLIETNWTNSVLIK